MVPWGPAGLADSGRPLPHRILPVIGSAAWDAQCLVRVSRRVKPRALGRLRGGARIFAARLRRGKIASGHERGPRHPGLRCKLDRVARNRRNANQDFAARALNLASGELFPTLQMLLAVRTSKLKFAHKQLDVFGQNMH
jgi:hypothetical protein